MIIFKQHERRGMDITGRIHFTIQSTEQLSDADLQSIQSNTFGFSPYGYSYFRGTGEYKPEVAAWEYQWTCSASCDQI